MLFRYIPSEYAAFCSDIPDSLARERLGAVSGVFGVFRLLAAGFAGDSAAKSPRGVLRRKPRHSEAPGLSVPDQTKEMNLLGTFRTDDKPPRTSFHVHPRLLRAHEEQPGQLGRWFPARRTGIDVLSIPRSSCHECRGLHVGERARIRRDLRVSGSAGRPRKVSSGLFEHCWTSFHGKYSPGSTRSGIWRAFCGLLVGVKSFSPAADLQHGEWLPWLEENVPFSHDTGRNYMKLYEHQNWLRDGKSLKVRNLTEAYKAIGLLSDGGVARLLTQEGVPAPRGEKWWGETGKGILTNPVYAGCNVYGRYEKGDTRVKPRSEWTVVPGMREPVVEDRTFRQVQKAINGSTA